MIDAKKLADDVRDLIIEEIMQNHTYTAAKDIVNTVRNIVLDAIISEQVGADTVAWQSTANMEYVTTDKKLMKQWAQSGFNPRALYAAPVVQVADEAAERNNEQLLAALKKALGLSNAAGADLHCILSGDSKTAEADVRDAEIHLKELNTIACCAISQAEKGAVQGKNCEKTERAEFERIVTLLSELPESAHERICDDDDVNAMYALFKAGRAALRKGT